MATHRFIDVSEIETGLLVKFEEKFLYGEIVAEMLRIELNQVLRQKHVKLIVVDFSNVKSISSAVIGSLMAVRRQVLMNGGKLRFCSLAPSVYEVFRTLNLLDTVFPVYADVYAATEATENTLSVAAALELQDE